MKRTNGAANESNEGDSDRNAFFVFFCLFFLRGCKKHDLLKRTFMKLIQMNLLFLFFFFLSK